MDTNDFLGKRGTLALTPHELALLLGIPSDVAITQVTQDPHTAMVYVHLYGDRFNVEHRDSEPRIIRDKPVGVTVEDDQDGLWTRLVWDAEEHYVPRFTQHHRAAGDLERLAADDALVQDD